MLLWLLLLQNLSEEVDARMLYDLFIPYGEIYQCKVDNDVYNQVRAGRTAHRSTSHP
jgi:RNA recognition motif-containing protein